MAIDDGSIPLHVAAEIKSVEIVRILLEYGANVGAQVKEGGTPLRVAAAGSDRAEVVQVLLEHGTNVGTENNVDRTPLHVAADNGLVKTVRVLLEHGANVGAEDNEGRTAFQIASAKEWSRLSNCCQNTVPIVS
jgi:ankyrin repeat protein